MHSPPFRWWFVATGFSLISCSDSTENHPNETPENSPPATAVESPAVSLESSHAEEKARTKTNTSKAGKSSKDQEPNEKKEEPEAKPEDGLKMPEIVGIESPEETDILWTAYYITPVTKVAPEEGRTLTFTDLAGKKIRYSISGKTYHQAEMEAVAVGIDKEGKKRFGYRVSEGVWRELPEGSMGMGNKTNPLVPLVHVAADQRTYPYGSLVHVPEAEGRDFGDGKKMTGYFWIADSGGRIRGNHFDLFVGKEEIYSGFLDTLKHQHHKTKIYSLPSLEKAWSPRNNTGLSRVLVATGHLEALDEEPDEKKLREALVEFQKGQPFIPTAEYGDPDAAITLWFLTQAAITAKKAEKPDPDTSD